MGMIT